MPSIVIMVTEAKAMVTKTTPVELSMAAGYINTGINGSHGPSTKIVNRIQGVRFLAPSFACT